LTEKKSIKNLDLMRMKPAKLVASVRIFSPKQI